MSIDLNCYTQSKDYKARRFWENNHFQNMREISKLDHLEFGNCCIDARTVLVACLPAVCKVGVSIKMLIRDVHVMIEMQCIFEPVYTTRPDKEGHYYLTL